MIAPAETALCVVSSNQFYQIQHLRLAVDGGDKRRIGSSQEQASEHELIDNGLDCRVNRRCFHGETDVTASEARRTRRTLLVQEDATIIKTHLQSSLATIATVNTGMCISGWSAGPNIPK